MNKVNHPTSVYLREEQVLPKIDAWLSRKFDPVAFTSAVREFEAAHPGEPKPDEGAQQEIAECDAKLRQHRAALEAGADPVLVTSWMKETQARSALAEARLKKPARRRRMTQDEIMNLVTELGGIMRALKDADPADKADLYRRIGLTLTYHPQEKRAAAEARPNSIMYVGACPRPECTKIPMPPDLGVLLGCGWRCAMTSGQIIRWSTAGAVVGVAAVAAVASYEHAYALVRAHGETGWIGRLVPLTVDGLIFASSMVLLDSARREVPVPALARWLLGLGIAATLAANVAHGLGRGPGGAAVAAWPAVALVGSYELFMTIIRGARQPDDGASGAEHVSEPVSGTDPLRVQAAEVFAADVAAGRLPSIRAIRSRLRVGQPRAQQVRAYLAALADG